MVSEREVADLRAQVERLRKALEKIACHAHCIYSNNESSQYGIGVTDGHRCAATIAREALNAR